MWSLFGEKLIAGGVIGSELRLPRQKNSPWVERAEQVCLCVLRLQVSISSPVKAGREPAGHEQELLMAMWGTWGHF